VEVLQTSNLRRLRLGKEKKEEEERRNHGKNIMVCPRIGQTTIKKNR